jgi:hypothetical protein
MHTVAKLSLYIQDIGHRTTASAGIYIHSNARMHKLTLVVM